MIQAWSYLYQIINRIQMNNYSKLIDGDQEIPEIDPEIEDKVRSQAYLRQSPFNHPNIVLQHQPINAKQCLELQRQLKGLTVHKIDEIKNNETELMVHDHVINYDHHYRQSINRDIYNQQQVKQTYGDIKNMHNMADMLLDPPDIWNSNQLYLYERNRSYDDRKDKEFQQIFNNYRKAYQIKQQDFDNGMALDTIRRAKRFLLKQYE